jgi:hypothetical protein
VGDLQSCAVPVDTASDRDVAPIDIERATRAGDQPVPSEVDVVDLHGFVAVEL